MGVSVCARPCPRGRASRSRGLLLSALALLRTSRAPDGAPRRSSSRIAQHRSAEGNPPPATARFASLRELMTQAINLSLSVLSIRLFHDPRAEDDTARREEVAAVAHLEDRGVLLAVDGVVLDTLRLKVGEPGVGYLIAANRIDEARLRAASSARQLGEGQLEAQSSQVLGQHHGQHAERATADVRNLAETHVKQADALHGSAEGLRGEIEQLEQLLERLGSRPPDAGKSRSVPELRWSSSPHEKGGT